MKRFYTTNTSPEELFEEFIRKAVVDRRDNNERHSQDRAAVFIENNHNNHNDSTTLF